jgi:hypothetical protein
MMRAKVKEISEKTGSDKVSRALCSLPRGEAQSSLGISTGKLRAS